MPTPKNKLFLLTPPPPEPRPELVEHALDLMISNELYDFANSLDIARCIWRKFPALVEGPGFPDGLRAVLMDQASCEPNDDSDQWDDALKPLEPGYRESIRAQAVEVARVWMAKECEENSDANFLGKLGIAG